MSSAETVKYVSKVILLTSVKKKKKKKNLIIFATLLMRANSLFILRFILVTQSCILRRTKQDSHFSYNVTLWRVGVTTFFFQLKL